MKTSFYKTLLVSILATNMAMAQQPAFPTAEGAGKYVTGGRGTSSTASTIYEVTKLDDDGSVGTLRYALTNSTGTYRTVVFRVSGTIHLTSALKFTRANTTVAGQTAPGDGICLADYPVSFSQDNIIVRYIRFRMGDKNTLITSPANCGVPTEPFTNPPTGTCKPVDGSGGDDAFGGTYRNNIIIDHCTMGWSSDESCSIYGGTNTTLQWNFFTEPLNHSYHYESGDLAFENHGYGGIQGGVNMSIHHNLYAHLQGRVPRFDGSRNLGNGSTVGLENADFRNNVLYNWGSYNTNGGEGGNYNIVNNYYKYGPSTSASTSIKYMVINPYKDLPSLPYGKYFLEGNYVDGSTTNTTNNWRGAVMNSGTANDTTSAKVTVPFTASNIANINTHTAQQTYDYVLASAGASLPKRDTLDKRIVNDVKNRTGRLIDVQGGYPHATPYAQTVNAWPTLGSITAPTDTDHDGMPDSWETVRGLNAALATDRNLYNINGYTNLENYLNGDSLVARGTNNTCVSTRSFTASNTGNWIHAGDTASSILISTDTLNLFASIKDDGNYGAFNASYYVTNVPRLLSNSKPLLNRNFTIVPSTPASIVSPVTVRLYFTIAEYNTLKGLDASISSLSSLRVLRRSDNACNTAISGYPEVMVPTATGNFGTYADGYYVEFTTSSFGTFFIAGSTAVVPLKLLSINAAIENKQTKIAWTTTNEVNTKNFVVEKSSDARDFFFIGSVLAKGNGGITSNYSFMDANPYDGVTYYHLKIFDKDGSYSYSPVLKVEAKGKSVISIYPNPATDNIIVNHPKAAAGSSLQLLTADGRKVKQYTVANGTEQTYLSIETLAKGNYVLLFTNNAESITIKLVKY
jgi:hypothetical protein